MGVVTGFTAARMLAIEAASIVSGAVNGSGRLILTKQGGGTVDAGSVIGPTGPTGSVVAFAGSSAPTGWLLCDGTEKAIATYPDLYAVLGTTYGALTNGSGIVGTTHFRLPNIKGRAIVGVDSAQVEFDVLGETGGAKTHVLTSGEMPVHGHVQDPHNHTQNSHNHTQDAHTHANTITNVSTGDHFHFPEGGNGETFQAHAETGTIARRFLAAGSSFYAFATATLADLIYAGQTSTNGAHTHANTITNVAATATNQAATATNQAATATNQNTGGGGAHNNLQPYIAMNHIIKT